MKTEDEHQNGEYENCYQSLRGQRELPNQVFKNLVCDGGRRATPSLVNDWETSVWRTGRCLNEIRDWVKLLRAHGGCLGIRRR